MEDLGKEATARGQEVALVQRLQDVAGAYDRGQVVQPAASVGARRVRDLFTWEKLYGVIKSCAAPNGTSQPGDRGGAPPAVVHGEARRFVGLGRIRRGGARDAWQYVLSVGSRDLGSDGLLVAPLPRPAPGPAGWCLVDPGEME